MAIGLRIYGQVIVIVERRHSVLEMFRVRSRDSRKRRGERPSTGEPRPRHPAQPAPIPAQKAPRVFCGPGAGWAAHTLNGL